jgi:hypothetical protein
VGERERQVVHEKTLQLKRFLLKHRVGPRLQLSRESQIRLHAPTTINDG